MVYASKVDDPWFNDLIQLLRARSPEFGRWRRDHDIELSKNRAGRPPASHS
jgi:hypothetical protein